MTQDCSDFQSQRGQSVAIIGLSCFFPGAENLAAYWATVKSGRDALSDIPADHWSVAEYFDPDPKAEDKTYGRRGGFLAPVPFEPLKYGIVPNDLSAIDTTQLLGLVAADRALKDAGYGADNGHDHRRTAVMLGVTGALKMVVSLGSRLAHPQLRRALADSGVDEGTAAEVLRRFANEFTPWQENSFPGLLGNVTAGRIANRLNLGGANLVVDAACASSLAAVRQALMELSSGQADLVVTGGLDTFSDPFMYTCFSKTPALSPGGEVRAYDQSGDGTILGEGIGVVVLKRLAEARADGDRIYAVIRAVGSSSDGKGAAIFAPTADGQVRALKNAYENAGIGADTVELVEGHGTGTAVGDAVEVEALSQVFRQSGRASAGQPWCALGSVKSQIGHTKAAAGVAGLIKAALALYWKTLPPAAKVKNPLPALAGAGSPFHLSTNRRPWLTAGPRRAGVSAFGFGGSNFHCVLEEDGDSKPAAEAALEFEVTAFGGSSPTELAEQLAAAAADWPTAAVRVRTVPSDAADCRLILVASREGFPALARETLTLLARPDCRPEDFPEGAYFGRGPATPETWGLLAPGPEDINAGLFRELAADWPEMFEPINEAAVHLAGSAPELAPLDLVLYPPDLASPEMRAAWGADLADPRLRAAVSRAFARGLTSLLARFGLTPAVTLGGEEPVDPARIGQAAPAADLWLDLGGAGEAGRLLREADRPVLTLDAGRGETLELAHLLGRLAARGLPVDFRAWPDSPADAGDRRAFTVAISGANHFVKRDIPPTPRPRPAAEAGRPLTDVLESLTIETARLHQDFLNQQAEALSLVKRALETVPGSEWGDAPLKGGLAEIDHPATGSLTLSLPDRATSPPSRTIEAPWSLPEASVAPAASATPAGAGPVLNIVAQETGYPVEMLALDMDLESDLGLDSIKKVEIMAVLGEKWPDMQNLEASALSGAATLGDLVALVGAAEPPLPPERFATAGPQAQMSLPFDKPPLPASRSGRADASGLWPLLREAVAAETGYPLEMLRPEMRLGDDLGLDSIKLVEIASVMSERLPGAETVSADVLNGAQTLGDLARALEGAGGAASRTTGVAPAAGSGGRNESAGASDLILEAVSRETGYPRDMLALDMNLEADLGLDSIKKVEIMAALSERLPRMEALTTADVMAGLVTLRDLAALVETEGPASDRPAAAAHAVPAEPYAAVTVSRAGRDERPVASAASPGDILLDVVAAETGYPREMLRFDAALEADLGLDSIKRVEIMAALSERLGDEGLAGSAAEALNGAVTLGDLRDLMGAGLRPETLSPSVPAAAPTASPEAPREARRRGPGRPPKNSPPAFKAETPEAEEATRTTAVTAFQVGLAPWAPLPGGQASTGLPAGAGVVILGAPGPLTSLVAELLGDQGREAIRLDWAEAPSLDEKGDLDGLVLIWPNGDNDLARPRQAFQALRAAGPALKRAAERGRNPLALGLTFMGGTLGLADEAPAAPVSAALTGLFKTAAREWPGVRVRALDLPSAAGGPEAASYRPALLAALAAGAPVELGLTETGQLLSPRLMPYKLRNIRVRHLREGQTLLVTGGARGVTAAALKEVARAVSPHLVIMGRTPLPPAEAGWLRDLRDEAAIRQALFDRAKVKPGPRELARDSARILAGRELKTNLAAMEKAGARVTYVAGDFLNPETLKNALAEIKRAHGPIHGFIHGAGILADGLILEKKDEDFDLVFDTKARMASLILEELAGQPLNLVAFFSSSTARFGRRGQADYAAGNEVLNKLARSLAGSRQGPKCLSVNWGPWEGGMVDAGLKRLFEDEGVGLIPLAEGARLFAALVGAPKNDPVEVVVLGPATDLTALE